MLREIKEYKYLYSFHLYENALDIRNLQNEFELEWNKQKPNSFLKIKNLLKSLSILNSENIKVYIEKAAINSAEFIAAKKPEIHLFLNTLEIEEMNKNNSLKNLIIELLGHEFIHFLQWKKGAIIYYKHPNSKVFKKIVKKCEKQIENWKDKNVIDKNLFFEELLQKSNDYELMAWAWTIIHRLYVLFEYKIEKVRKYIQSPYKIDDNSIDFYFTTEWPDSLFKKKIKFKKYCYDYFTFFKKPSEFENKLNERYNDSLNVIKHIIKNNS